jgi:hypothetical protein
MMQVPLNETQIQEAEFDFDLNFLANFVKLQIGQGKKEYDMRRR